MMDQVFNQIMAYMIDIFFLVATIGLLYVLKMIKAKLSREQQELLESIASAAVLYVQQTAPNAADKYKLDRALDAAERLLQERGLSVDVEAMKVILESQLKILKSNLADEWKKTS